MNRDQERELDEDGCSTMRLWKAGELPTAIKRAMASNAKAKAWLGEADPRYAAGLAALARIYFDAGQLDHAEAELLEYADTEFRQFGAMSREYAEALSRLSIVCAAIPNRERDAGNLRNAADAIIGRLLLRVPDVAFEAKLQGLHRNLQRTRSRLHHEAGRQAETVYDYAAAESHYRRGLASIPPDASNRTSLAYTTTQSTLAGLLSIQGRLGEAEAMGEEAHERLVQTLGHNDLMLARSLCDLAVNRSRMGKAEAAMNAYEEAIKICDACTDEALSTDRMDLQERAMRGMAVVLLEFAHAMKNGATVQRAIELLQKVDPLARRHGLKSREFGMHLADVAKVHRMHEALGSAYSLLEASTGIFRELGDEAKELYHTNLLNMGELGFAAGYLAEARDHLEESLAWHRQLLGEDHEEVAKCLSTLIEIAAFEARRPDFLELIQALQRVDDAIITNQIPLLKEADALRQAAQIWWRTGRCMLAAATLGLTEDEGLSTVYQLLISRRGVVLASLIARARGFRGAAPGASISGEAVSLIALRRALREGAALVEYVRIDTERFGPVNGGAGIIQRPKHLDLDELAKSTPLLQFDYACSVDLADLTERPGRYLAVVVTGGESGGLELLDLGPAKPIEDHVDAYKQSLVDEHIKLRDRGVLDTARSSELGLTLGEAILDPVRRHLQSFPMLFVVPDGMIGGVPLEGLPTQGRGNVLDEVEIAYLYNARDLLPFQVLPARSSPIVVGNPDYDAGYEPGQNSWGWHFQPLPGSEEEARSIASILKVAPLLGGEATKSQIQTAKGPEVLHLATHGIFFNDERAVDGGEGNMNWAAAFSNPLRRSVLALAGANRDDMGTLSAEEVLTLDLSGTQLVTVSACHSGSGVVQLGEGVLGFARAFAIAGAQNVVVSVWETSDEVTRRFMQTFYLKIYEGAMPPSALRAAKLKIRALLPHPFYWNAFMYQGAASARNEAQE